MSQNETESRRRPVLLVDETHMGRRASGIERITADLFSQDALPELEVLPVRSGRNRPAMMATQTLGHPFRALRNPASAWVFPGYPPSPLFAFAAKRSALYVHDLFLLTRPKELNLAAKLYMAKPFRMALRSFRHFLVNSEATRSELASYVSSASTIMLYRPVVRNVFGLKPAATLGGEMDRPLVLGALGTVEPRKNFLAAARLREALQARLGRPVELHIVGRRGWGNDFDALSREAGVTLHGFLSDEEMRSVVGRFDLFVCTSHAEGLGLPLLELQYAGIPVIAPDQPIFREVLGDSGLFIDPSDPREAAAAIEAQFSDEWRRPSRAAALANIDRWNHGAAADREAVTHLLKTLATAAGIADR